MKKYLSFCLTLIIVLNIFLIKPMNVEAAYELDWGYMWWMSDSPDTYEGGTCSWDSAPKFPDDKYDHWSGNQGPIGSSGWEAYDIKWTSSIPDYYTNYAGAPPKRPWLEYYASGAPAGTHYVNPGDKDPVNGLDEYTPMAWRAWNGEFISSSGIANMYRKVAIVYYRRPLPNPINLTATYYDPGEEFYEGCESVDVGVNIKNNSEIPTGFNNVGVKITFNGKDYFKNVNITAPGVDPGGINFIFTVDAPGSIGNFPVTINVNYNHNPIENLPTLAAAYDDNIVNGVVTIKQNPTPPGGSFNELSLTPEVQLTGVDANNRVKSGYSIGLKLDSVNNIGEVRADNFGDLVPTLTGFIKISSAKVSEVNGFSLGTSNPVNMELIIGKAGNDTLTSEVMSLSSNPLYSADPGILKWDFGGKPKPVVIDALHPVLFKFSLASTNNYGATGAKPVIYIPPTTPDGEYSLQVGGGNAAVEYEMVEEYNWWHALAGDGGGHWHKDLYYLNESKNITIDTTSMAVNVKGSMFDDDTINQK